MPGTQDQTEAWCGPLTFSEEIPPWPVRDRQLGDKGALATPALGAAAPQQNASACQPPPPARGHSGPAWGAWHVQDSGGSLRWRSVMDVAGQALELEVATLTPGGGLPRPALAQHVTLENIPFLGPAVTLLCSAGKQPQARRAEDWAGPLSVHVQLPAVHPKKRRSATLVHST